MHLNDAGPSSFLVFNKFSQEIGLLIMEMCSALDLAELAASSRRLRTLIEAHPHVWRRVQSNFARGVCPGLPSYASSLEATANCSQAVYARWIFGGGFCTWCKQQADAIPFNFHLHFRACSQTKCERALSSGGLLFIDTSGKYDKHPWGKWLARFKYEPQWGDFFLYSTAALKDAVGELKQAIDVTQGRIPSGQPTAFPRCTLHELIRKHVYRELSRPALSQNAVELESWSALYIQEKKAVTAKNLEYLKVIAAAYRVKFQGLMRCSTMSRVFSWFNRDLTSITLSVWMEHEKVILGEYNSWRGITVAAPKSIDMPASETAHKPARPQEAPKTAQDKILCPYCRRQFSSDSLSKHVVVKHPDVDPNAFAPPGLLHCLQCPRSTTSHHRRLFTVEGLLAHQLAEHSPEKTLCPHCPGSEKTFSPGPLAQHIKAKHSGIITSA